MTSHPAEVAACRFCRSDNIRQPMQDVFRKWIVGCADCGAEGPQSETPGLALIAWSAPDPELTRMTALVEQLREAGQRLINAADARRAHPDNDTTKRFDAVLEERSTAEDAFRALLAQIGEDHPHAD